MKQPLKKTLSILLALFLLLTLLPLSALAAEEGGGDDVVSDPPVVAVTGVSLSPSSKLLSPGGTDALSATVSPENATDKSVTWTSSDSAVAAVGSDGLVTAKAPGEADITVTTKDGGYQALCKVTVSGLVLSETSLRLVAGNSATLGKTLCGDAKDVSAWEWSSSDRTVAQVHETSGKVTAVSEGKAVITCRGGAFSADCTVTVTRNAATTIRAGLTGGKLAFSDLLSQLKSGCSSLMGASLSYVTGLSVADTGDGILYYGYVSESDTGAGVASGQKYYASGGTYQISQVVFVPKPGFSGTASIKYTGFTAGGQSYTGEVLVEVEEAEGLAYSSQDGRAIPFQADDFSAYCQTVNGRPINYVTFSLPAARYGSLYYNYTGSDIYESDVTSDTRYYRTGSLNINNLSFVPNPSYSGTFTLSYTGCDTAGNTFRDSIRITVSQSSTADAALSYSVRPGGRVYFDVSDFSDLSYDETGYQLSYVRFTPPSSSRGVLYYDGDTKVTSSTSYYRSGSGRLLKDVSFLADEDYTGAVSISFTGRDTQGNSFDGTVKVTVSKDGGSGDLSYTARPGQRLYFDVSDFSDASYDETGYQLSYVRFTLPASSRGVLYYDGDTKVTSSTSYYRSGSGRLLEDVSFIPDEDFTGTVNISFTGYDTQGNRFDGTVRVTVSGSGSSGLSYTGYAGQRLYFDVSDFSDLSYDETGYQLNYVRFTLPASSRGILYYDGDTKVTSSTSYYRSGSGRLLEDVSFIPDKNFTGTVNISFTGYDTRGNNFDGAVQVTVSKAQVVSVGYVSTGPAVTLRASDLSALCADALSGALSYVRIIPPDASVGTLYYNYVSPASQTAFSAQQNYYVSGTPAISQLSFVPKAGYSGTVHVSFTGTDNRGKTCTASIRIQVAPPSVSSYFSDMGSQSWAVPSVDFLRYYGVVSGTTATTYAPSQALRRGDFVLMLSRAFAFENAGTYSFRDVPQTSHYAAAIAAAKAMGIVTGDASGNFQPTAPITRQAAAVMLYRCLQARGSIAAGSAGHLDRFADANRVSSYAVPALGALVRDGIFAGDANGYLNPGASLTRAQMAVILHRALT